MGAFYISVSAGGDGRVPIDVAGGVMMNIQRLLTDIGRCSVKRMLSLQGDVPKEMLFRFTLYINDSQSTISSSADMKFEGPESLLNEALADLFSLLERVSGGSFDEALAIYNDPRCRTSIQNDLRSLLDGLGDFVLNYSADGKEGSFSAAGADPGRGDECIFLGDAIGILRGSEGEMFLEMDEGSVPLEYEGDLPADKPCVINGRLFLSDGGEIEKVAEVRAAEGLPCLSFDRIISVDKDLALRSPIVADIDYDKERKLWILSNTPLGISLSKERLDDAILEFHDHIVFMWEVYDESSNDGSEDDFSEDEMQLREYILSVVKDDR
ncbi:MAG: hypothetical protein FWG41_00535 [Methanomassiliicoccaceae archaeon]|nr:hypothetical protein [Methanomassiliicoccaceae archaeon]